MLKSIVSCILTGFLVVPFWGRAVNTVLITPSQNLVLCYYYFLIITDFSASSIGSEREKVINKCSLDGQVGGWMLCCVYIIQQ